MVISVWAKFGAETEVDRQMIAAHLVLTSAASTGEPGEAKESENWVDLFDPKAQKLFWSDIDHNLFRDGLDGWWLDASEPEGDPLKNDMTFLGPGKMVRNAFPLYETSAVYNGQRATDEAKRVVILSRSAWLGQQRNGSVSWSGDITCLLYTSITVAGFNYGQLNPSYLSQGAALETLVPDPFANALQTLGLPANACDSKPGMIEQGYLLEPYPEYCGGVSATDEPVATNNYNALQASFKHRFSQGLLFTASYTFSKFLSDTGGPEEWGSINGDQGGSSIRNFYNLKGDWSVDGDDIPHSLVLNYVYDLSLIHI